MAKRRVIWNGDTSSGSPYFRLRQEGLSHNEAVARLNLDPIDLEAEREGSAIRKANESRVRKASKKAKVKSVDSNTLDKAFFNHYGYNGYTSRSKENE